MKYGIIAAGQGSRLCDEGIEVPKPLVKINGETMIGRLINIFGRCSADSVSVVINAEMPEVADFLEELSKNVSFKLNWKIQSTPSSMHTLDVLTSLIGVNDKCIVTTVDTIFLENNFRKYVEAFRNEGNKVDGMMAVTRFIDDEKPLYVATDSSDYITGFYDQPEKDIKFISGGIYGLTAPCLKVLKDCISQNVSRMRNYQRALISNGLRLKAYDLGKIIDVDHAGDIKTAEDFINEETHNRL